MADDPIQVLAEQYDPSDFYLPSVDVCAFCTDPECGGVACIACLDVDDDWERIERLHRWVRAGQAMEAAIKALAYAEGGA